MVRMSDSLKIQPGTSIRHASGTSSTFLERATFLADHGFGCSYGTRQELLDGKTTPEKVQANVLAGQRGVLASCDRWIAHYENRLAYERAMLTADGGTVADKTGPEKGGACKCWVTRGIWLYIVKVNKISVTIKDNWDNGGDDFTRTIPFDKLTAVMTAAQVVEARESGKLVEAAGGRGFHLLVLPPELIAATLGFGDPIW